MSSESSEFANEPVAEARTVGWVGVALVSAMVSFSLPTFVAGVELFAQSSNENAILAILLGSAILAVIGALTGAIGARTRLSSYLLVRVAFGDSGASVVNIAFAISLLGWFGVNIDLFAATTQRMLLDVFGVNAPGWIVELFAGVIMTITTMYGFRTINFLSMLLTPVMMVVTALLLFRVLDGNSWLTLYATGESSSLPFGNAVSSVVGGIIVGAVILPDITRFIRHWPGAIYTAFLSYFVVSSIVMIAGGLAADTLGNDDFLDVMIILGLGWAAFAIVIAGSWVLNSLNLYSTALSIEATWPSLPNRWSIIVLGAIGTLAAFLNILDYFLDFLFYLAIVFVPVAGIIVVDYLWVHRTAYHVDFDPGSQRVSIPALLSWVLGATLALLGAFGVVSLSGIAALDAMFVSALAFALLSRVLTRSESGGVNR
ncbi:MAG: cytosine permease [Woeseiaceae bacterium]